jgi:hypothetical protein
VDSQIKPPNVNFNECTWRRRAHIAKVSHVEGSRQACLIYINSLHCEALPRTWSSPFRGCRVYCNGPPASLSSSDHRIQLHPVLIYFSWYDGCKASGNPVSWLRLNLSWCISGTTRQRDIPRAYFISGTSGSSCSFKSES